MWKYLIDTKILPWNQKINLFLSFYLYDFKRKITKDEVLVYKDKTMQHYVVVRGKNVILHVRERNRNKLFKRYDDKYFIV